MGNFFYEIDLAIFYFFNHTIANPFLDSFFVVLTTQECWYIAYGVLIFFLLTKFGTQGKFFLIFLIFSIVITDQLSSHLIKEIVGRVRPCHILSDVRLLVACGGGKSFPSSHAVNNFALAVLLSNFFKVYRYHFFLLAGLVAISRVYVGVHYPSDVICGAVIGFCIAQLMVFSYYFFKKKFLLNSIND